MTELINQIDKTFNFNENTIRVIGTYNEPWFIAKDICNILELPNVTNALKILPEKWRGLKLLSTFGGEQNMNIINEAGLYKLIMRSNKPIAQKFQEVVCEDILPSLRKKGEYQIQSIMEKNKKLEDEKLRIEEENNLLTQLHIEKNKEIKKLQNKVIQKQRRPVFEDRNCVYMVQDEHHKKERIYVIGKAIDLMDRLGDYNKAHETEIIYYRSCNSAKQMNHIEKCILTKLNKYKEVANHDRFILPKNEDISLFTNVFDLFVDAFSDVDPSVDIEKDLTEIEQEQRLKDSRREYIEDNRENSRLYRQENAIQFKLYNKQYIENNKEKVDAYQTEYRENNKDAFNAYSKEYYDKNKEIMAEQFLLYRKEHRDELNEINRKYYEENREEFSEYKKEYYQEHKEATIERAKEYYINNKETVLEKRKELYANNKEKILAYQGEKVVCECGMTLIRNYMAKHKKTKIHQLSLQNKLNGIPYQKVVKVMCDCGHEVKNNYMKRHLGSKIHETGMKIKQKKMEESSKI